MKMNRLMASVVGIVCASAVAGGDPGTADAASYAAHLAAAHAHYRLGEYDDARRWLEGSIPAHRGWEYGYLSALLDTSVESVASGHESLAGIDLSSDGALLAVAATDGGVEIRDVGTLEVVRRIGDHAKQVYCARFSPDGRMVATVARDQRASVWSLDTGELLSRYDLPSEALADIAFSPDSSVVALCTWHRTAQDPSVRGFVRVWRISDGGVLREAEVGVKPLSGVAFTPDGERVVMSSWDGLVHVLETRGDGPARDIALPNDGLYNAATCIAVSPDGALAAAGSRDSTVRVFDLSTGGLVATLRGSTLDVLGVAFSRDGAGIACSGADGAVRVWRTADWSPAVTLVGHTGSVRGLMYIDRDRTLVSAGYDGTIRVWDTGVASDGITRMHQDNPGLYNAAYSPDGRTVAASCHDGRVCIWDAATGETRTQWMAHDGSTCHTLCYSADGSQMVTGSWDQTVRLWDASTGALVRAFEHAVGVYDCAITPDGSIVAAGLTDGSVHLWSVADGSAMAALHGHQGSVMRVVFSHDGRTLATAGVDGVVNLWSMPDGAKLASLEGHRGGVSGVAFTTDDGMLASCAGDGRAILWDVGSASLVRILLESDEGLKRCSFSPDASRLVVAGAVLHVVDVAHGGSVLTLRPHVDAPYDTSFSPDGGSIASCSTDGSLVVIGARRGRSE